NQHYLIEPPSVLATDSDNLVILVLAWNFLPEIKKKIMNFRQGKQTWIIVPFPRRAIWHIDEDGICTKMYEHVDTRLTLNSLSHKTILLSHFYNESSLLTSWIRHHAPLFDQALLIDHHSTDSSRRIIAHEAPSSWRVVTSQHKMFDPVATD